jgi:hypothetical protein
VSGQKHCIIGNNYWNGKRGQAKDIIIAFMSSDALKNFRLKDGKPGMAATLR